MPRLGRNTWPRKKVRQVAHVACIFDADEDSGDGGPIAVESGSNYFVSVDDSVCDGGRLAAEYSLSRAGSVHRILRNSKQPLPPGELSLWRVVVSLTKNLHFRQILC